MITESAAKRSTHQLRQFWQSHLEKWRVSDLGQQNIADKISCSLSLHTGKINYPKVISQWNL
jgi:hypothetical protein